MVQERMVTDLKHLIIQIVNSNEMDAWVNISDASLLLYHFVVIVSLRFSATDKFISYLMCPFVLPWQAY